MIGAQNFLTLYFLFKWTRQKCLLKVEFLVEWYPHSVHSNFVAPLIWIVLKCLKKEYFLPFPLKITKHFLHWMESSWLRIKRRAVSETKKICYRSFSHKCHGVQNLLKSLIFIHAQCQCDFCVRLQTQIQFRTSCMESNVALCNVERVFRILLFFGFSSCADCARVKRSAEWKEMFTNCLCKKYDKNNQQENLGQFLHILSWQNISTSVLTYLFQTELC